MLWEQMYFIFNIDVVAGMNLNERKKNIIWNGAMIFNGMNNFWGKIV